MTDTASRFREYVHLDRKRMGDGLTPQEIQRWLTLKRHLAARFSGRSSDPATDTRVSVRVPTNMPLSFEDEGQLRRSLMTNLSRGGLFVATEHLVEIGTRILLRIRIERDGTTLTVPAEVVCHDLGPDLRHRLGFGLRFLDLEPDVRRRIDALYEQVLLEASEKD